MRAISIGIWLVFYSSQSQGQTLCAQDVMHCPDGSFVFRDTEKDCEFMPCETANDLVGAPGSDVDQYGCIGSAGYTWCVSKNNCIRLFEEDCPADEIDSVALGSDEDQYGCKSSAGYSWCASKSSCIRIWEEDCPVIETVTFGRDVDQYGCIGSAGYTWCASKNRCIRIWEENCPMHLHGVHLHGSDVDQYGCLSSGGFTWCASKKNCIRIWEEDCPDVAFGSNIQHGAIVSHQHSTIKCGVDQKECGDGTFVSRDPQNNCDFHVCEQSTIDENGDIDQFGCRVNDGYSWCAFKTECIRSEEEECPTTIELCRSTQDCSNGKYCLCNPNIRSRIGWQNYFLGTCVPWQQDGQTCNEFIDGCQQQCAPDLICYKNPLHSNVPGVCGAQSDEVFFCLDEVKRCPDGTFVSRNPENKCDFYPCKYVFVGCTEEPKQCPDGTFVYRVPERKCDFSPCNYATYCTRDIRKCPDGTLVYRNPQKNCQFNPCRYISLPHPIFPSNWRSNSNNVGPNLGRVNAFNPTMPTSP